MYILLYIGECMNTKHFTDRTKYKQAETAVILILGIAVLSLWQIGAGILGLDSAPYFIFQLGIVLIALLIYYLFRRWANAEDELTKKISEKAAQTTIIIYGVGMLFISIFFTWAGTISTDAGFTTGLIGVVLQVSLIYLWCLYLVYYYYYSRRLGISE